MQLANININNSNISFLGYDSPFREGISINGGHVVLADNRIHDQYYGIFFSAGNLTNSNNSLYDNIHDINNMKQSNTTLVAKNNSPDSTRPFVSIRYPVANSTIASSDITVEGTAFDEQGGIQKVEVFEHTYPFNNQFPYKLAVPMVNGSWSNWKYHFNMTEPGLHRVSARVTDLAGNQNWAETLFQIASKDAVRTQIGFNGSFEKRIAVVDPLFTDGAYNVGGFYEFYPLHEGVPEQTDVYKDLNLLTSQIPDYDIESRKAQDLLVNHLQEITNRTVSKITDEDIHEGYIFNDDGSNAYDVLLTLHEEYATKQSYR